MDSETKIDPNDHRNKLVEFEAFRCMAYLDAAGKWRCSYANQELTGFVRVVDGNIEDAT